MPHEFAVEARVEANKHLAADRSVRSSYRSPLRSSSGSRYASRSTATTVNSVQPYTVYDRSPWNSTVSNSYRNRIEIDLHNRAHNYVSGHMGARAAPNPVFWLRHCNIDRLWWRWQSVRGIDTYQRRTGTTSGVVDNSETMRPFATGRTPAAVANIANMPT